MKEKVILFLISLFGKRLRDKWYKELKAKGLLAILIVVLPFCSGCDTLKTWYVKAYDSIAGTEEATTVEAVAVYDSAAEQALADKSPRISNKTLPEGDPTIKITGYTWGKGSVTFESNTSGTGKVPEGHEYLFIITNGNDTENAAASHGVRDSRLWSKVENPTSFMITLVKDSRSKIIEYSATVSKP